MLAKRDKRTWTIAGAVIGSLIGNQLGKYLDDQDRKKMEQATARSIETGQSQTWSSSDTNTRGTARVVSSKTKQEPVKVVVLKQKVSKVPPLEIVGATYQATKRSNVRGGPGKDYVNVGKLQQGEAVNVVGKVKGQGWFLISQDGIGSGFVFSSLLEPAPDREPDSSGESIGDGDLAEAQVQADRLCRTVEQSVSLSSGTTEAETVEVCKGPDGWERKQA